MAERFYSKAHLHTLSDDELYAAGKNAKLKKNLSLIAAGAVLSTGGAVETAAWGISHTTLPTHSQTIVEKAITFFLGGVAVTAFGVAVTKAGIHYGRERKVMKEVKKRGLATTKDVFTYQPSQIGSVSPQTNT